MAISEMREPTFFILTALVDGRKHGYALISETERLSAGRTVLRVGTLYAALDRLEGEGLVESDGDEVVDGRLRRYYRLTDDGIQTLDDEVARLENNVAQAKARLTARRSAGRLARGMA
jgi:DNA-binding PadR family transcriptional regulator